MHKSRSPLIAICCCVLGACIGCTQGSRNVAQLPIEDRLRDAYPELATGRFVVIADFEDSDQVGRFRLNGDAPGGSIPADSTEGVKPTGGGCLEFTLGGQAELVAEDASDASDFIPSDWSAFNLLLMNVSANEDVTLEFVIEASVAEHESRSACLLPLIAGWNPIALDLKEVAEQVPLREVRGLRWRIADPHSTVRLKLDDLVLADSRQELFGDPRGAQGTLYVVREGRHTNVGACGRFELGFLNGQIVRWYALDTDPDRRTNLVGPGNVLGPAPVELEAADIERQIRAGEMPVGVRPADRLIAARQRVVEAQPGRIILECDWMPGSGEAQAPSASAIHWTYAVYPTGDVYVTVSSQPSAEGARTGLAVSRLPVPELTAHVEEPAARSETCFGALGAPGSGCLVFVPRGADAYSSMRVVRDPVHPRVSLLALGTNAATDFSAACLLTVWPPANCESTRQNTIAESYALAPEFEFLIGQLDRGTAGDLDSDGFNERYGAYALALHENRLHMRVDGKKRPLHQPVFVVPNSAGKEVWVYVDHFIFSDLHRDVDQNVVFQLPDLIDRPIVIELYARGG